MRDCEGLLGIRRDSEGSLEIMWDAEGPCGMPRDHY